MPMTDAHDCGRIDRIRTAKSAALPPPAGRPGGGADAGEGRHLGPLTRIGVGLGWMDDGLTLTNVPSELAEGPQVAMRLLKRSIYNAAELSWAQSLDEIAAKTAITDHHPDAREGVTAFHEKRQATFNDWLEQKP